MTEPCVHTTVVRLSGVADMHTIADAHLAISKALAEQDRVDIDVSDVTDLDLTLVQLLESARLTAAEAGKPLALVAPATAVLRETLERGGFINPGTASRRFWLCEGE